MRMYGTESASVAVSNRALATNAFSGLVTGRSGDWSGFSCDFEISILSNRHTHSLTLTAGPLIGWNNMRGSTQSTAIPTDRAERSLND